MPITLKLTRNVAPIRLANANFAYVASPTSRPTITTSAISDISRYSTTEQMLANDATTYANAINYVANNYTPSANLRVSTLTDIVAVSPSNNATLVYSSANNKYVVKQLDLDGGNF